MLRIFATKGLPASGKSTWAKNLVLDNPGRFKRTNKDEIRSLLDAGKWSKDNEAFVLKVRDYIIHEALNDVKNVIVDDTNLHPKHIEHFERIAKKFTEGGRPVKVEVVDFTDESIEECIKRDNARANGVGESVIRKMYRDFLAPKPADPPKYDSLLPDAICVDLDGTLALLNGRDPYDASTCDKDLVNWPAHEIVCFHQGKGRTVIFVSGREDKYREPTERFLTQKCGLSGYLLFMRPTGNFEKDAKIKREIYESEIRGKFNVLLVLDDRDQVVTLWRSLGLTCFQVADGDF